MLAALVWLWASPLTAQITKSPFDALHFDIIGSPTVLNDGTTANTIVIGVTNFNLQADQPEVVLPINSTISIRFVAEPQQSGTTQYKRSWALATINQINAGKIRILRPDGTDATGDWTVTTYPGAGQTDANGLSGWTLTAKQTVSLRQNQSYYIEVSNLITNAPSGATLVYYEVADAAGKNPSRNKFGPLNKTREVERNGQVGINTADPKAALDVNGQIIGRGNMEVNGKIEIKNGGILVKGGAPGANNSNNIGYFFGSNGGDNDSGMSSVKDGHLGIYTNNNEVLSLNHIPNTGTANAKLNGNLEVTGNVTAKGRIQDKTGDVMPVGSIIAYGGSTPPDGWLLCDGKQISWQQQPVFKGVDLGEDLRKVLRGTSTNPNDGWNTPDLRSRFIVGAGGEYSVGNTGGAKEVTLTVEQMPSHNHLFNPGGYYNFGLSGKSWDEGSGRQVISADAGEIKSKAKTYKDFPDVIVPAGGKRNNPSDWWGTTQAHENRPPYYALTYIIKY